MTQNKMHKNKRLTVVWAFAALIFFVFACERPGLEIPDASSASIDQTAKVLAITPLNIVFYPDNEVYFHDDFALFCTTLVIPSVNTGIGAFDITIFIDSQIIQFESINSYRVVNLTTIESDGQLQVNASNLSISPGDNLDLFTITWKAVATAITDVTVQVNSLMDTNGQPIEGMKTTTSSVKILKKLGTLSFNGLQFIKKDTAFTNSLHIDTGEAIIKEYDLDINYDPNKLTLDDSLGIQGVEVGPDGFIGNISVTNGKINISGTNGEGKGPSEDLDFLKFNWIASNTGKTTISITINKIKTIDNVYIKPDIRNTTISIFSESKKPILDIRFEPETIEMAKDGSFMTKIVLNTEGYVLAAYGFDILYDPDILEIDKSQASGIGIEAGKDGFLTAVNSLKPGIIKVVGFDLNGITPSSRIELINIYWKAKDIGVSELKLSVQSLADVRAKNIDLYRITNCTVTVQE